MVTECVPGDRIYWSDRFLQKRRSSRSKGRSRSLVREAGKGRRRRETPHRRGKDGRGLSRCPKIGRRYPAPVDRSARGRLQNRLQKPLELLRHADLKRGKFLLTFYPDHIFCKRLSIQVIFAKLISEGDICMMRILSVKSIEGLS